MKKLLFLGAVILIMGIFAFAQNAFVGTNKIVDFTSPSANSIALIPAVERYGQSQDLTPLGLYDLKDALVTTIDKNGEQTLSFVNITNIPGLNDLMVTWDGNTVIDVYAMR
jgi:hypothetical protein